MEEVCVHAVSTEEGKSAAKFQETLHQQIHTPIETRRCSASSTRRHRTTVVGVLPTSGESDTIGKLCMEPAF